MYLIIYTIFLIIYGFNSCATFDEVWKSYEKSFINANREEIVVTNVTSHSSFKSQLKISKWTTLNLGVRSYTMGLSAINESQLEVILFNQTRFNEETFDVYSKVFDIHEPIKQLLWFHQRKNLKDELFIIVALKDKPKISWYKLENKNLTHFWDLPIQKHNISYIDTCKIGQRTSLGIAYDSMTEPSIDFYEIQFKNEKPNFWFTSKVDLQTVPSSFSFNLLDETYYLSVPQTPQNAVLIFKYENNQFLLYENLISHNVASVVSFEIGFKNFLAFDGFNAGIYQFTPNGLKREKIVNSNLDDINFWISIPVETYRDEVILLAQRLLDHTSHKSFDVDVVTYNGVDFEEHEDVMCLLFGEEQSGLKCLADTERNNGIIGTGYIVANGQVGLLVPRIDDYSILFMVNIAMKQKAHPKTTELELLQQDKKRLQQMIDDIKKGYEDLEKEQLPKDDIDFAVNNSSENVLKSIPQSSKYHPYYLELQQIAKEADDLKLKIDDMLEWEEQMTFDTLIINGEAVMNEVFCSDEVTTENIEDEPVSDLFNDIVRKNDISSVIGGHKTFTDLVVKDLNFENLNGIPAKDFIMKSNDSVTINGDVEFLLPLEAENLNTTSNLINNINILSEFVDMDKPIKDENPLEFENVIVENTFQTMKLNHFNLHMNEIDLSHETSHINITDQLDTVFMPGNVTVTNINGVNLQDFLSKLCLKNIKTYIPNLEVNDTISVNGSASANFLNDLSFPKEFVTLKQLESPILITGVKNFTNGLEASQIDCTDLNGVKTTDFVTLSTEQYITGNFTFSKLSVNDEFNVNGSIKGVHPEKFIPNYTLKHSSDILAGVEFSDLEVLGSIYVKNSFNGQNFDNLLEDIIYKTQKNVDITAQKEFIEGLTVRQNLEINSEKIGDIPIESIVTQDTDQILDINSLKGIVNFENLFVENLFGHHNITQLNQDIVRVNEEKDISSHLVFTEPLYVDTLEILDTLNENLVDEYLFHNGDSIINSDIIFENITIENMFIQKDLESEGSDFDLEEFKNNVISLTKNQDVNCSLLINDSEIEHLEIENINGFSYDELFSKERARQGLWDILEKEDVSIKILEVNGSIHITNLNDKYVNNFNWLTQYANNKVLIVENVYFNNLEIKNLSNVDFNDFIHNVIYKDEANITIESTITFAKTVEVKNLLETDRLNGIKLNNILRQDAKQEISGPIIIHGDVDLEIQTNVSESINDIQVNHVFDMVNITENGAILLKDNMVFKRLAHIKNLTLLGLVNNKSLDEKLENMIFVNTDATIHGNFIFKDVIEIGGDLIVNNQVNNYKLSEIASDIVWITKDAEIEGPFRFTEAAEVHDSLKIHSSLDTKYLFGKNLTNVHENAVFIDRGLLEGNCTFKEIVIHEALNTNFINNVNMDSIIPLRTKTNLEYLEFEELTVINDIHVGNLVNGVNLSVELDNTVLKNKEQTISSEIVFLQHSLINGNLTTPKINQIETDKIVTTDTDQNLTATYIFDTKCSVTANLTLHKGTLNGDIDFNVWKEDGIKLFSNDPQVVVDGDWEIAKNLTFNNNVNGIGFVNGYELTKLAEEIELKRNYKLNLEKDIIKDYENLCIDINYIHEQSKSQIYKFKYFEELQNIVMPTSIRFVKHFHFNGQHYLWINDKSCHSYLLKFKDTSFVSLLRIESGHISDLVSVKIDEEVMYLVTNDNTQNSEEGQIVCTYRYSNIWQFRDNEIKHILQFEKQDMLQESMIAATFYGLNSEGVTEYNIHSSRGELVKHRKWSLEEENTAFMPRELNRGLAIRTGHKIIHLNRPRKEELVDEFDLGVETVIYSNISYEYNHYIPGRNGKLATINVGSKSTRKTLLALASHRETSVFDRLDLVEIYLDPFAGTMFQKLPTYKPSSLTSIEFGNGETLLAFLENGRLLQIYEYKGIEGFKPRFTAKLEGSELFSMTLPIKPYLNERKVLGIIDKNNIILVQAIMSGNKIEDNLNCNL